MNLTIEPFAEAHLDGAAELLATRHRANRARMTALPARFDGVAAAREVIRAAMEKPDAAGVVAVRGGRMTGYLLGAPLLAPPRKRSAWVDLAGHAAVGDDAAEVYRSMYAALAPRWVAAGCFMHYVMVPALDEVAHAAFWSLGFGQEQAHAIRSTAPTPDQAVPADSSDRNIEIRRGGPEDQAELLRLAVQLPYHQAAAPVFAAALPEFIEQTRAGHTALLAEPAAAYWLARRDGWLVSFMLFEEAEPGSLIAPDGCVELVVGVTDEAARGSGVGGLLLTHAMAWAREAGYAWCLADWRTANLPAARFWSRHGFRPMAYRLHRAVDERIAWAHT